MAHSQRRASEFAMPARPRRGDGVGGGDDDDTPLVQSRETGDVIPSDRQRATVMPPQSSPFAKSWVHFVAGGCVSFPSGRSLRNAPYKRTIADNPAPLASAA